MILVLKLSPKENYFTEELVGILWIWIQVVYFKLKEIWPLFSIAKAKKTGSFFFFFLNESNSQSKFGLEVSSQW